MKEKQKRGMKTGRKSWWKEQQEKNAINIKHSVRKKVYDMNNDLKELSAGK